LPVAKALERAGDVPLPPYIRRRAGDPEAKEDAARYQTVYARNPGSVAAPTAGLHFDEDLLGELATAGVGIARVTLSVGYGTFSPIRTEEVEEYAEDGTVEPSGGTTRKFILPGYRFRAVDAVVTNFHLPRSSLLALVMAFSGVDAVRAAYREAVAREYRFYSYGDAMFIE
ncbi:MAG: S-adenosylmethionine--tRNA ribosyltransferase-isomerase, partial [Deltaproteobacteria bacterium]|nr:S-adenosylmethionine--tRNA ribosyltransferase-isomerase [Deltaproteobacteria bacterium]